jgi:hypothetical protein
VSAKGITDELVQQVADDLRARLADSTAARSVENIEFAERFTAERFTDEHRETFDRLAE